MRVREGGEKDGRCQWPIALRHRKGLLLKEKGVERKKRDTKFTDVFFKIRKEER